MKITRKITGINSFPLGRLGWAFILLFTLFSCDGDDDDTFTPTLPAITQTGANNFGCYIGGKLLTPRDGRGSVMGSDPGMIFWGSPTGYSYNEIDIHDFKSDNGGLFTLHIQDLHQIGEGTYTINESNCQDNVDAIQNINLFCEVWDETDQTYKWYCSIENGGTLTITRYDFDNRIVSGTFNCTVQNRDDTTEQIEITQGRFDINWQTLPNTDFP